MLCNVFQYLWIVQIVGELWYKFVLDVKNVGMLAFDKWIESECYILTVW